MRSSLGERYPSAHGGTVRNTVAVVGMVIESGTLPVLTEASRMIEHEGRRKFAISRGHPNQPAPYRDKILALLGTGLTKRQIAEKVGCSYHSVDYWHRKVMAS